MLPAICTDSDAINMKYAVTYLPLLTGKQAQLIFLEPIKLNIHCDIIAPLPFSAPMPNRSRYVLKFDV